MPIGPISNSHREISVVEPVSPALERVKAMLFKPFAIGKWFTIGFCAWLAYLGEGGGGGGANFHNNINVGNQHHVEEGFRHGCEQARDFVLNNFYWIVPVALVVVVLLLALWGLILWVSSRGKFMFLHCVALDRAEVAVPWEKFAGEANSLFWFRLVLGLAGMVLMLPMLVFIVVLIARMVLRGVPDAAGVMLGAGLGLALLLAAIVFALIRKFTMDFVVPIQFLRGGQCLVAWKEFWALIVDHAGQFALYILFQIVLGMAIGIIVLGTIFITCCIAGCLMTIPYLGTVLLLPVLVFKRSYSLYFLAQFGPAYNVFPAPAAPSSPPPGLQPSGTA
jgi:hypothetical protein